MLANLAQMVSLLLFSVLPYLTQVIQVYLHIYLQVGIVPFPAFFVYRPKVVTPTIRSYLITYLLTPTSDAISSIQIQVSVS